MLVTCIQYSTVRCTLPVYTVQYTYRIMIRSDNRASSSRRGPSEKEQEGSSKTRPPKLHLLLILVVSTPIPLLAAGLDFPLSLCFVTTTKSTKQHNNVCSTPSRCDLVGHAIREFRVFSCPVASYQEVAIWGCQSQRVGECL